MEEYRVQMLVKGEWKGSREPYELGGRICYHKDEAFAELLRIEQIWNAFRAEREEYGYNTEGCPTAYRVVSRRVTEWKEVN